MKLNATVVKLIAQMMILISQIQQNAQNMKLHIND